MKSKEVVGKCPICSRDMIKGASINDHHFIPKSKGGKAEDKITLHVVCHNFYIIYDPKRFEINLKTISNDQK